ncbi:MAG: RHS repeat-associated core domain-containing protein [Saprospiraceae bacterium]|nr:RHS repeat-associated core domain-containing protein [Saprospiraceae bacterium]
MEGGGGRGGGAGGPVLWQGKQHLRYPYVSQSPILDSDVNGVDWVVSGYNGLQQPDLTIRYVFEGNGNDAKTWQNFTYDNGRRLTDIKFNYATGGAGISSPTYTLSNMVYNFKDQLVEKNIGLTGANALQSIDYTYNSRGFLTNINNVALYNNGSASIMTPPMNGSSPIQNLAIAPFVNKIVQDAVQPYRTANALEMPPVNDNNADLFSQNITYDSPASQTGAAAQNNGNISSTTWQVLGRDKQAYGFTYDGLDRLTEAKYFDITEGYQNGVLTSQYSTDNKFKEAIQYDVRGNILSLQRNGMKTGGWTQNGYVAGTYGVIDNLTYGYNTKNQLIQMIDNAVNPNGPRGDKDLKGFVYDFAVGASGNTHYSYDNNGNMTKDAHKDITAIEYNYLNLPQVITLTAGRTIQFVYDATGAKLKKITNDNGTITTFDYINGVEYKNNTLQRIPHTEGAVVKNEFGAYEHEYVLRDHLGNNRVTFRDGINKGDAYWDWNTWTYVEPNANNTTGYNDGVITAADIKQINHYYPFGLNMEGNWNGAQGDNKYQYNGKEWNNDFGLGLNDYGARWYDPAMARWTSTDPLAEKFKSENPYNYVLGNPIKLIDPNGMDVINSASKTTFTGADAAAAFRVLTGSATNVYVVVGNDRDGDNVNSQTNSKMAQGHYNKTKWAVFAVSNYKQAVEGLKCLQIADKSLDKLVIEQHGGYASEKTGSALDSDDNDNKGTASNVGSLLFSSDIVKKSKPAVKYLSSMLDKVKTDGMVVFVACHLADGTEENKKEMAKALTNLSGNRLNLYMFSGNARGSRTPNDAYSGHDGSVNIDGVMNFNDGKWYKVDKNANVTEQNGSLYISSDGQLKFN